MEIVQFVAQGIGIGAVAWTLLDLMNEGDDAPRSVALVVASFVIAWSTP